MNTYGKTQCPQCGTPNSMFRPLEVCREMPAWDARKCFECGHEYKHSEQKPNDREYRIDEILVRENVGEGSLQLFFPDKPCERVRELLKENKFYWLRKNKAWQRQLSSGALAALESIKQGLSEIENAKNERV